VQSRFNEAGVRDAGDPHQVARDRAEGLCFNEAGVRDAGDRHTTARRGRTREGFNEAGVRDAGDPPLDAPDPAVPLASTRPACETPEI